MSISRTLTEIRTMRSPVKGFRLSALCKDGEYRITLMRDDWLRAGFDAKGEKAEAVAYYTTEADDAVGTARAWLERADRIY